MTLTCGLLLHGKSYDGGTAGNFVYFRRYRMTGRNQNLIVGVLGMSDNQRTKKLIDFLINDNISLEFVIYWKPKMRDNYRRFRKKLKASGIMPTIQRIYYAVAKSKSMNQKFH